MGALVVQPLHSLSQPAPAALSLRRAPAATAAAATPRGPMTVAALALTPRAPDASELEHAADAMDLIFDYVFSLLNRDNSGFADEADVVAALQCKVRTREAALRVLAREEESGHVDQHVLRKLLESLVPASTPPLARHEQLVKDVLAVVKDFGERSIAREEYHLSEQAEAVAASVRDIESTRAARALDSRKVAEQAALRDGQAQEADEFNKSWTVRMGEFNALAHKAVRELRKRHAAAVDAFLTAQRPRVTAHLERHHRAPATLEATRLFEKLKQSGEFLEAERMRKRVEELVAADVEASRKLSELELQKKLDVRRAEPRTRAHSAQIPPRSRCTVRR